VSQALSTTLLFAWSEADGCREAQMQGVDLQVGLGDSHGPARCSNPEAVAAAVAAWPRLPLALTPA
jgi:hypothetical protein